MGPVPNRHFPSHRRKQEVTNEDISTTGVLREVLFIFFPENSMNTLKTIDQLAPDTIQNYRSKLRRMFLRLPALTGKDAEQTRRKIARLETQLGVKAESIGGPGRPRRSKVPGTDCPR
jgi:hypothetical protein